MSFTTRLFSRWKSNHHKRKIVAGVSLLSTAALVKSRTDNVTNKDEVVFLSREENAVPSKAKVQLKPSTLGEMRGPILPNGQVNFACACIEHSVIGPCGQQFRKMRTFIHNMNYDKDNLTEEKKVEFEKVLEDYFMCTMDHPKYYMSEMLEEEKADFEELERIKNLKEQRRLERWKKHFRRFGKDMVMFLPQEENNVPTTAIIDMTEVEELRAPLLPNGQLNWACTCIEKDVVGPCNVEFRRFRQYIHDSKNVNFEEMSPEQQKSEADLMREIVRSFLNCCQDFPVYYHRYLKSDGDGDMGDLEDEEK